MLMWLVVENHWENQRRNVKILSYWAASKVSHHQLECRAHKPGGIPQWCHWPAWALPRTRWLKWWSAHWSGWSWEHWVLLIKKQIERGQQLDLTIKLKQNTTISCKAAKLGFGCGGKPQWNCKNIAITACLGKPVKYCHHFQSGLQVDICDNFGKRNILRYTWHIRFTEMRWTT